MLHLLTYPQHSVNSVCFSADGDLLVSGSDDTTLKIWSKGSSGNFECKSTLRGHDCKEGCLCSKENEGRWNEKIIMNPDCPVTGHSDW